MFVSERLKKKKKISVLKKGWKSAKVSNASKGTVLNWNCFFVVAEIRDTVLVFVY